MELKVIDIETAKLVKEVGICIGTMTYYFNEQLWNETNIDKRIKTPCYNQLDDCLEAPTQELLRQFLRTEHNIHIQIYPQEGHNPQMKGFKLERYEALTYVFDEDGWLIRTMSPPVRPDETYESVLEKAEVQALKYLLNQKE